MQLSRMPQIAAPVMLVVISGPNIIEKCSSKSNKLGIIRSISFFIF